MPKSTLCSIPLSLLFLLCLASPFPAAAGPLTSAQVTKIINQVSVIAPSEGPHPAALHEVIKDDLGLQTGAKSRSELLFQDNTLTRIGAETFFSFKTGTRDMTLERGSMLLQVPKGLGGAKIRTAAVTAVITGTTIMMEYIPNQYVKVLVLEGSLRLSRNGSFGDSLLLKPGKMVIMRPDSRRIPEPIDVDLANIVKTSSLINLPHSDPLPSMPLIQASIDDQNKQMAKNNLIPTNLVIGRGTNVVVTSKSPLAPALSSDENPGATVQAGSTANSKTPSVPAGASPAVSVAATTTTPAATTVTNLLNATVSAPATLVSTTVNNTVSSPATVAAVTTLPVSSSNQIVNILNTTAPSSTGVVNVVPAAANLPANVVSSTGPAAAVAAPPSTPSTPTNAITGVASAPAASNPGNSRSGGLLGGVLGAVLSAPSTLLGGGGAAAAPTPPPTH